MVFQNNSRYQRVGDYLSTDAKGNRVRAKKMRRFEKPESALTYIVKDGDRLDLLAYKFYGDPTKFWLICDANDEMLPADLLVSGRTIIIPKEGI